MHIHTQGIQMQTRSGRTFDAIPSFFILLHASDTSKSIFSWKMSYSKSSHLSSRSCKGGEIWALSSTRENKATWLLHDATIWHMKPWKHGACSKSNKIRKFSMWHFAQMARCDEQHLRAPPASDTTPWQATPHRHQVVACYHVHCICLSWSEQLTLHESPPAFGKHWKGYCRWLHESLRGDTMDSFWLAK